MGAGSCPEGPVWSSDRREPPGLVPGGAGAKGSFLLPIKSHKKICFRELLP